MSITVLYLLALFVSIHSDERGTRVKRIVGGYPAEPPPADDPAVYTNFAGRSALVRGVRNFPHYVFKGIRYAHPPTGKERFLVSFFIVEYYNTLKKSTFRLLYYGNFFPYGSL